MVMLALPAILLSIAFLSITNCGLSDEVPGVVLIDPGKYAAAAAMLLHLGEKWIVCAASDVFSKKAALVGDRAITNEQLRHYVMPVSSPLE